MIVEYHQFKTSRNPRKRDACERCGRLPHAPCHISLLSRVEAMREAYLDARAPVEDLAERLPTGWERRFDDPDGEGSFLARALRCHLAEFQCGKCDEGELRKAIAATR